MDTTDLITSNIDQLRQVATNIKIITPALTKGEVIKPPAQQEVESYPSDPGVTPHGLID